MNALLITLALCVGPQRIVIPDTVDVIELNHYYDAECKLVFSQWVFWEWDRESAEYRVRDWRLCRDAREGPEFDARRARWRLSLSDASQGYALRRIEAIGFSIVHSQVDRELENRKSWPMECRRLLTPPNCRGKILAIKNKNSPMESTKFGTLPP